MSDEKIVDIGNKPKIKKHRSPNYPYLGLREALTKTDLIRKTGGVHPVGFNSAMSAWGLKEGTTNSVIAALKAFGLIDVSGEKTQRQLTVSETARKILVDHSEKDVLLKKAALAPTLYAELWKKFGPDLPPTTKPISEYLIFTRHFNENVVDSVIADFQATIGYARLSGLDKMADTDSENDEYDIPDPSVTENEDNSSESGTVRKLTLPPRKDGVMYSISIDILEDGLIEVSSFGPVTMETFGLLKDVFDVKTKHESMDRFKKGIEEMFQKSMASADSD